MTRTIFKKKSVMKGSLQQLWDFHAQPNAFAKLTPPPIFIRVRENKLKSLTEGTVDFTMWLGPIPLHWVAQHEAGPTEMSFTDRQLVGPMAYWEHQHSFRAVMDGVELTDHVTLEHKPGLTGLFTRLFFDGIPLQIFFFYRHLRTRLALAKML
ncbi:MAG: SRPBCC family protein [Chloroflexi bacterium]|nr:SRPBCC family protein [Chloroflexota bacterium]